MRRNLSILLGAWVFCVGNVGGAFAAHEKAPCDVPSPTDYARLDEALASRPKDHIVRKAGLERTLIYLNGKEIIPRLYKLSPDITRKAHTTNNVLPALFAQYGFNFFIVPIALANYADDGAASRLREKLRAILVRDPSLHLMLEVNVGPWEGWAEAHPHEVFKNDKGEYGLMRHVRVSVFTNEIVSIREKNGRITRAAISYCSTCFAQAAAEKLTRLFAALENMPEGKAVSGAYINGGCDGQWFDLFDQKTDGRLAGDYSDAAREGFRDYLKNKYGTPARMAKAWGCEKVIPFNEVAVPTRADFWVPRAHFRDYGASRESDYREYIPWALEQFLTALYGAVSRASGGRLLVGGYHSHGGLSGYPKIALAGLKYRLSDPITGFTAIVPPYEREWTNAVVASVHDGSLARHGILYVSELDLRNPEHKNWGLWGKEAWRKTHNAATFRTEVFKHVLAAVTSGGAYHAYDMNGGWYSTPNAMATWREAAQLADSARDIPLARNRIALVGGEDYFHHQSFGEQGGRMVSWQIRRYAMRALAFCGVPRVHFLLDDVVKDKDLEMPGVILFNDLSTCSAEDFQKLRARFGKDGRVLIYLWKPGIFSAGGKPLANLADSFKPTAIDGLLRREENSASYTEYLLSDPKLLTPDLCRMFAREAGIRPLLETNEILMCGSGIFAFLAQTSGEKSFRLPPKFKIGKVLLGPLPTPQCDYYTISLNAGDLFAVTIRK